MCAQPASVSIDDIRAASARIAGRVLRTPMVPSAILQERTGAPVHLKLEHHQTTGSFKLRGATNAVLSLTPARLDEPLRRTIQSILFDQWLTERREAATIEWYWGNAARTSLVGRPVAG